MTLRLQPLRCFPRLSKPWTAAQRSTWTAASDAGPTEVGVSAAAKMLFAMLALRKQHPTKSAVFAAHLKYSSILSEIPHPPSSGAAGRVYPANLRHPVEPMCRYSEELRSFGEDTRIRKCAVEARNELYRTHSLLYIYRRAPGSTFGVVETFRSEPSISY